VAVVQASVRRFLPKMPSVQLRLGQTSLMLRATPIGCDSNCPGYECGRNVSQ
jgi:hypothetical protein